MTYNSIDVGYYDKHGKVTDYTKNVLVFPFDELIIWIRNINRTNKVCVVTTKFMYMYIIDTYGNAVTICNIGIYLLNISNIRSMYDINHKYYRMCEGINSLNNVIASLSSSSCVNVQSMLLDGKPNSYFRESTYTCYNIKTNKSRVTTIFSDGSGKTTINIHNKNRCCIYFAEHIEEDQTLRYQYLIQSGLFTNLTKLVNNNFKFPLFTG